MLDGDNFLMSGARPSRDAGLTLSFLVMAPGGPLPARKASFRCTPGSAPKAERKAALAANVGFEPLFRCQTPKGLCKLSDAPLHVGYLMSDHQLPSIHNHDHRVQNLVAMSG